MPANPFTPVLQRETDEWAPLDLVFMEEEAGPQERARMLEATPAQMEPPPIIQVTDLPTLKRLLEAAPKEKLAAKCTSPTHLEVWRITCGGDRFMELGMLTYWKEPELSPKRLAELKAGRQRKFGPDEEKEFYKLLDEEKEEDIVVEVPDDWPLYVSPVNIVPKHSVGENGEAILAWRKVWDGRVVNAEQVDIHFKMEGPQTVQKLMQKNDWLARFDLKSAFNHLRVHESMMRFLCFRYGGKSYAYKGMPFGSKHTPRLFKEALSFALKYIRRHPLSGTPRSFLVRSSMECCTAHSSTKGEARTTPSVAR
jgi:hypothetical protein